MASNSTLISTIIPSYGMTKQEVKKSICHDCRTVVVGDEKCGCENPPVKKQMFNDDGLINEEHFKQNHEWCLGCQSRRTEDNRRNKFCTSCQWDIQCMLGERRLQLAGNRQMEIIQDELDEKSLLTNIYVDEHTVDELLGYFQKALKDTVDPEEEKLILSIYNRLRQLQELGYRKWRREHDSSLERSSFGY